MICPSDSPRMSTRGEADGLTYASSKPQKPKETVLGSPNAKDHGQ
jgi:hypothetical protein